MMLDETLKHIKSAEKAEAEAQALRDDYLPVATRGALLYFLVADLAQVSTLYQFPLDWFQQAFASAITTQSEDQEHGTRKENISLKEVCEIINIPKEPNMGSEKNLLSSYIKNAVDALTKSIFQVRYSFL